MDLCRDPFGMPRLDLPEPVAPFDLNEGELLTIRHRGGEARLYLVTRRRNEPDGRVTFEVLADPTGD